MNVMDRIHFGAQIFVRYNIELVGPVECLTFELNS